MLHEWHILSVAAMVVSVGGLFALAYFLNFMTEEYYHVMSWIADSGIFWLFGHFYIPIACVLIDLLEHSYYLFFEPTNEIIFREAEQAQKTNLRDSYQKVIPV